MPEECDNGTRARLDALTRMLDERENRGLERYQNVKEIIDRFMLFTDERFKISNEWREALTDLTNNKIQRGEYAVQQTAIQDKIDSINSRVTFIMGVGFGLNFVIVTVGVLVTVFRH